MRTKTQFKIIRIYESTYESIIEDMKEFERTIGGGTWSIADAVMERNKILLAMKEDAKEKEKAYNKKKKALNK